jgi:hypothetical protein
LYIELFIFAKIFEFYLVTRSTVIHWEYVHFIINSIGNITQLICGLYLKKGE